MSAEARERGEMGQRALRDQRRMLEVLDRFFFGFAGVAAVWLAYLLLRESFTWSWHALALVVVFWALVAYLVLPRLHRMLTHVYLPDYFIGRARTSDGLLGDPLNLAVLGSEDQVHAVMGRADWIRADDVTFASSLKIIQATLQRRPYAQAPVSPLMVFGRQQDFAYQQEVAGSPAKRHHVRFWKCPPGWRLPGGFDADWLAAATYDKRVGLSLFTLQVTHKIAADVDAERDHVVATLQAAVPEAGVRSVTDYSAGYHARNGGGDEIETDGDLPFVDLRGVAASASAHDEVVSTRARARRRPSPTVFGSAVAVMRGLVLATTGLLTLLDPANVVEVTSVPTFLEHPALAGWVFVAFGLVDLGLGVATYRGSQLARIVLLVISSVEVLTASLAALEAGRQPTFSTGLWSVTLSILVLLALSSTRAREYASR